MSLFPYFFRDMMRPMRMMENQMRMTEELINRAFGTPMMIKYRNSPFLEQSDVESVVQDKEKFQVKLDVQNFKPEEITVKTLDGNAVEIAAKHEETQDKHGFISRQFVRRFVLPQGHELKDIVSSLSADGILTITAPRKAPAIEQERVIPITHTGPEKPTEENTNKVDEKSKL